MLSTIHQRDVNKVFDFLSTEEAKDNLFRIFFGEIKSLGTPYLIGGAIRDICNNYKPRDIDVIIDCKREDLQSIASKYNHRFNRFGGVKLEFQGLKIDIWTMSDNWAFKENVYLKSEENIEKGSFYNFDSIVINISTKQIYADFYNECIDNNCLDIIITQEVENLNPNPEINVLRAYYIEMKHGVRPSNRLKNYIQYWANSCNNPVDRLKESELKHFQNYFSTGKDEYQNYLHRISSLFDETR